MDFEREHSYFHIDMSKKLSIILPIENICDTPPKYSEAMKMFQDK